MFIDIHIEVLNTISQPIFLYNVHVQDSAKTGSLATVSGKGKKYFAR